MSVVCRLRGGLRLRPFVLVACAVAALIAFAVSSSAAALAPVPLAAGEFVASVNGSDRLSVLTSSGKMVGEVPGSLAPPDGVPGVGYAIEGLALSGDRHSAYVAMNGEDELPVLENVDLATGRSSFVANGIEPAVSPGGGELAYLVVALRPGGGSTTVVGLAIMDLSTGAVRTVAAPAGPVPLRVPSGPLNWSPDGRTIAVFDGSRIRLVDAATATDLASQPSVPGDRPNHPIAKRVYPSGPPPGTTTPQPTLPPGLPVVTVKAPPGLAPTTATSLAPVFLDARTLVAVYDCCIGYSHLMAFDLRSGRRTPFATLYGPPRDIRALGGGRLLVVTAANLLVVASRAKVRLVATGVAAAAG